ncbi:MAG: PAS domain S-box protein [Bacteroidota bacterium]|jgi:PAS domain S-box-containing protein
MQKKKRLSPMMKKSDDKVRRLGDDRKLLREKLLAQAHEAKQFEEILSVVNGSLDPKALLRSVLQKMTEVLKWDAGAIYVTEDTRKCLKLAHQRHVPDEILQKLGELSLDEGIGGLVAKTQEPHHFPLEQYPSYLPFRAIFKKSGISGVCFLPLSMREELLGMMLFLSKNRRIAPSVQMLSGIGRHVARALANAISHQALLKAEEQYRVAIESVNDIVYKTSPSGAFLFVSPTIENLVGHKPKEFYRNPTLWLGSVHPDDKKVLLRRVANLKDLGARIVNEYRVLPKGKAVYRWVRDVAIPQKSGDGDVVALQGIMTDITDYREAIEDLRQSHSFTSSVLGSIQEGIVVLNTHLKCIQWNDVMEEITGLTRKEVLGRPVWEILGGKGREERVKLVRQALAGETASSDTLGYQNAALTTEQKFFWERYMPRRDGNGTILGVIGLVIDVSESKRLEHNLRESEQILRKVIDTINDVLLITDLKGNILQVNRAFMTMLGYSRTEAIGRDFPYPWLVEEEMGRYVLWISSLRERSWLRDFDMTWRSKDNRMISMSLSTTLLRNSMGEPIAMLNLARDITERKQLAKELERRNQQVELINRVISTANQTQDFDKIFSVVAKEVRVIVPCDEINVGLVSEDATAILAYAVSGPSPLAKGVRIPVEHSIAQFTIRSREPVIIPDLSASEEYKKLISFEKGWRSQMSLPILLKGGIIATLNLASKQTNTFSDEHARILFPLAQHLGTIIDRVRLFDKVTEDVAYIHNLLDSIDSIVYTVDTECRILEVNKAWHAFVREYGVARRTNYQGMSLYDSLPDESLKSIFKNVIPDLLSGRRKFFSQEFLRKGDTGEKVFQVSANPLIVEKRITGLVISHADITALKLTEEELKKNNEQLLALNQISALINTSLKLQDILETVLPLLKTTMEAHAVAVYLADNETGDLALVKEVGFEHPELSPRLPLADSATGGAVVRKEPFYVSDRAASDERIVVLGREALTKEHIEAFAAIPLIAKDRVLGALDVFYRTPHTFSPQLTHLLELVGNQLGSAIENAKLYEETIQKSLEIERRNKELDDFTYVVSHDLKEPLISIEGFAKILQSDYEGVISSEGKDYLDSVASATTRMKALINDLLMLSRVSRSSESSRPVSVGKIIDDLREDMEFTIRQKNAAITVVGEPPTVVGNETHLKIVLSNLIANALKFNTSPAPQVEIGFRNEENNYYLFYVKDNGIGIEKEFLERIFVIFERLHRREDYEGTGAGLAIVKKIIELQKGKIWAESELGKGSIFYFTIPKVFTHD